MAEVSDTNPQGAGRPVLTPEELKEKKTKVLQKIEPYLKSGLSVNKALREAQIANSEFYAYMREDEDFRERIDTFRQFTAVLLNNALVSELQNVIKKQNGYTDPKTGKHIPGQKLTKEDKEFLWKFALNSNITKQEWGERKDVNLWDPEAEIQKIKGMLEEVTTKEIKHD